MRSIASLLGRCTLIATSVLTTALAWSAVPALPTGPTPGTTSSPGPLQAGSNVTLRWGAVAGATRYGVGVRDLTTNALVVSTTTSTPSYTASLAAGRPYRWNVQACNASACSSYTTALYFQTPAAVKALSSVSVSCPPTVKEGASIACAATASFSDGSTQPVTNAAAWSENSNFAAVSAGGVLSAAQVSANQSVTVSASVTYGDVKRSGNAVVTIVDVPQTPYTLNVGVNGTGVGKVVGNAGGIACGNGATACSAGFALDSSVVLTATPDAASSTFTGWGGACAGTSGSVCTLKMAPPRTATTSVSATFTKKPNLPPALSSATATQNADGSVTVSFSGSDPEGGALGMDAYLSTAGGTSFNTASKKSVAGVASGGMSSLTWSRAQADQYMTAGQTYAIAVDVFDTQGAVGQRRVTASFKRNTVAASLNELITSAALAQVSASSPRSLAKVSTLFDELDPGRTNTTLRAEGKTWYTDLEDGTTYALQDGVRVRNAMRRYATWDASPPATRGSLTRLKTDMQADIGQVDTSRPAPRPVLYDASSQAALVARIIATWDARKLAFNQRTPGAAAPVVPSTDQETMDFLGFRMQCFEWVANIGLRAGAKSISYSTAGVSNRLDHRAGMAMFWYTAKGGGAHAAIITRIETDASGNPTVYHVAESNYASGWNNPGGAIPWERTIRGDRRITAVATPGNSPTDMTRQGRVVRFVPRN